MGGLISFLFFLLIFALVIYVVILLIDMLPLPHPVGLIAKIIIGIVGLLILLQKAVPLLGVRI